jgi:rubrerythrin
MASLREAVEYAVAWEEKSQENYLDWSGRTENVNARQLFRNLAQMEAAHITLLKNMRFDDIQVNVPNPEWVNLTRDLPSIPASLDQGLKQIFEYAMGKEESVKRYRKLGEAVAEAEVKNLFKRLAEEETRHKALIRDEYHRLFNPV